LSAHHNIFKTLREKSILAFGRIVEKKRPLGIPTLFDRIVQEALRMILEPIWEADFSIHSYGFRPNRSTYDAMTYIGKRLTGNSGASYQWVIEGDIASYLDHAS
jgi:RNA-directed DNA polymerase